MTCIACGSTVAWKLIDPMSVAFTEDGLTTWWCDSSSFFSHACGHPRALRTPSGQSIHAVNTNHLAEELLAIARALED